MKKYRLLKDLPDANAGAVFEERQISCTYKDMKGGVCYGTGYVENNPDWFEEVQEKEFTKDNMISYACYQGDRLANNSNRSYQELFDDWIKQCQ